MNPAAATPVINLTEAQAVEELDRLLDAAPDEEDQLAHIHWHQANAGRVAQLEQHIVHLQKLSPEPTATKEETPMSPRKQTPEERVQIALECYLHWLAKTKNAPADRSIRKQTSKYATHIRALAKRLKVACPDIPALPDLAEPRQRGPRGPQKARISLTERPLDEMCYAFHDPLDKNFRFSVRGSSAAIQALGRVFECYKDALLLQDRPDLETHISALQWQLEEERKRQPTPYREPTAEDLRALLPTACAEDCVHPDHHHQEMAALPPTTRCACGEFVDAPAPDARFRRDALVPMPEPTAGEIARSIRSNFWPLCQAIESLPDRESIRRALDVIYSRLQTAYALLDEDIAEKGA